MRVHTRLLNISWLYSYVVSFIASRRSYFSQPPPGSGGDVVVDELSWTINSVWYVLNVERKAGKGPGTRVDVREESSAHQLCGFFYKAQACPVLEYPITSWLPGLCGLSLHPFDSLFEATNSRDYLQPILFKYIPSKKWSIVVLFYILAHSWYNLLSIFSCVHCREVPARVSLVQH